MRCATSIHPLGELARLALFSALMAIAVAVAPTAGAGDVLEWGKLPPIPDAEGFAGAFAGVSNDALIVAGGANITGDKWAEPLRKQWYDSVFVLERPDGVWKSAFRLARPLGYGVSVTTARGLVCVGGSDAQAHHAACFLMEWRDGKIVTSKLPDLPKTCANMCGAMLGDSIYVAGGIEKPDSTTALKTFWRLDFSAAALRWEELEPWPGPERMLAVAGADERSFCLFSGAKISAGPDGKPMREYLRDAYRFTPGSGWKRLADMPRAAVAAPTPAIRRGSRFLIASGDDGANVSFQPVREHPGFPHGVLAYDAERDTWGDGGAVPFSRATVTVVHWRGRDVIPNGEVRPRVRTAEVWAAK